MEFECDILQERDKVWKETISDEYIPVSHFNKKFKELSLIGEGTEYHIE